MLPWQAEEVTTHLGRCAVLQEIGGRDGEVVAQAGLQCASVQCDAAIGAILGQLFEEVRGQKDGGHDRESEQKGPPSRPVGLAGVNGDSLTRTNLTAEGISCRVSALMRAFCSSFFG